MMKRTQILTVNNAKETVGLHFTIKHTGKMEGMQSLSTSCLCNTYCKSRSADVKTVCKHCYAQRQMYMYKNLEKCLRKNTELLNNRILNDEEIPLINAAYFRFESFGDLNSWIQVANYFNMCNKNKNVHFALWTKNPWIIHEAISKGYKKPNNLQIILSSVILNVQAETKYDFIDKIFTVYDKDYIKENDIVINCGSKSCLACHQCYVKNNVRYVNEKLK